MPGTLTQAEAEAMGLPSGAIVPAVYHQPPPTITFYESVMRATGADRRAILAAAEALEQEWARHPVILTRPYVLEGGPAVGGDPVKSPDEGRNCPVCRLYDDLAKAASLARHDVQASMVTAGALAPGLGGTIPQIRGLLIESRGLLGAVSNMLPGRTGQMDAISREIGQALALLAGMVTVTQLSEAVPILEHAAYTAHGLAQAYYARGR